MTSNALLREETIVIMARALKYCDDLDDRECRDACYHLAGIGDEAIYEFDALAIEREQIRRERLDKRASGVALGIMFAGFYAVWCATPAYAATADINGSMSWIAAGVILGLFLIAIGLAAYAWSVLFTIPDNAMIEDGSDRSDVERRARNAGLQ